MKILKYISIFFICLLFQGCEPDCTAPSGNHGFSKWAAPTTNNLGEIHQTRTCTNCGYIETKEIFDWNF